VEARKEEPETARTQPHETEKPAPAKAREKETAPPQEKPVEAAVPGARTQSARLPSQQKEVPTQPMPSPLKKEEARIKASPVARRLADEHGVELGTIQGTGPDGRIVESDVRAASKPAPAVVRPAPSPPQKVPMAITPAPASRIQLS